MIPEARSLKFVSLGKVVSARLRSSLEVLKENPVSFLSTEDHMRWKLNTSGRVRERRREGQQDTEH